MVLVLPSAVRVRTSIIVPSWTGEVQRLKASLETQTYRDYELLVIQGVSPASRARNLGVAQTRGDLLLFIDDDAFFGHERVLETMVALVEADATIGIVGPSKLLPPDASWLQRRIAAEVPRWVYPVESEDTESNPPLDQHGFTGITTTCCIVRRSVFEEVRGFDEELETGEDPEFFYRVRRAGYRFVIPSGCWVNHDPPPDLRTLLRKSFRYGIGHAFQARRNPERHMDVVPLGHWYGKLFLAVSPVFFIPSIFLSYSFDPVRGFRWGFRPIKALSTFVTLYGYAYGWWMYGSAQRAGSGRAVSP